MAAGAIVLLLGFYCIGFLLLVLLLWFSISGKLAATVVVIAFAIFVGPPFVEWAWYNIEVIWRGGYYERNVNGVAYGVNMDEENGF